MRSTSLSSLVAAVAATLTLSSVAHAFEVKHTKGGAPVHWPSGGVVFEVDPSVDRAIHGGSTGVAEALSAWSGQAGAPVLSVAAGDGKAKPGNDGHNVVFYAPDGYPGSGSALAVTVLSFDEVTGEIVDADIVLNGRHALEVLDAAARPTTGATPMSNEGTTEEEATEAGSFDVVHVVAHETGHALGLADETSGAGPLMYLYTLPNDASARAPSADDLAGVATLYPPPAAPSGPSGQGSQGCGQATVAASQRRSPWEVLVVAVGLAAAAARRRRAVPTSV